MLPEVGWLKLNVDASVQSGTDSFAIWMVIRDDLGNFVQGKNLRYAGIVSVMEAEDIGVQEALQWIKDMAAQRVIIETDSLLVINAVQKNQDYQLEVGNILVVCRSKLRLRPDLVIRHVKKRANRVAHLMVRIPCLLDSYNMFMSPPRMVLESLYSDVCLN